MSSIADSPVSDSPAMTKSSVAATVAAVASRKLAWSSTTQTRTRSSLTCALCGARLAARHGAHTILLSRDVVEEHQHSLDPPINRVVDGQAELGENRINMLFHRPLRQEEPLRHPAIAEPGCQFCEHLAFPGGQPAERRGGARLSQQRLHHQRIEHRPAGRDLVHRLAELVEM